MKKYVYNSNNQRVDFLLSQLMYLNISQRPLLLTCLYLKTIKKYNADPTQQFPASNHLVL